MIYPSADTIEERIGSRYSLVVVAAKRAKQIKEGAPVLIETASTNPLTIALEEIAAGKVAVGEALVANPEELSETEETSAPSLTAAMLDNDIELDSIDTTDSEDLEEDINSDSDIDAGE